jgi:imidazolonepropionase-like amidohydrolase
MKLEPMFGSVAVGRSADLVLLEGDPLTEIANIRRISGVMWRGKYYDKAAIEKLKGR